MAKYDDTEYQEQVAFFKWLKLAYPNHYPVITASSGGGYRAISTAVRLKASGVKAGVPDIFLPIQRFSDFINYPGLYIEMKCGAAPGKPIGVLSKVQIDYIKRLIANGYAVYVCNDWVSASTIVKFYLDKPKTFYFHQMNDVVKNALGVNN